MKDVVQNECPRGNQDHVRGCWSSNVLFLLPENMISVLRMYVFDGKRAGSTDFTSTQTSSVSPIWFGLAGFKKDSWGGRFRGWATGGMARSVRVSSCEMPIPYEVLYVLRGQLASSGRVE